jgi:hypothetical protein
VGRTIALRRIPRFRTERFPAETDRLEKERAGQVAVEKDRLEPQERERPEQGHGGGPISSVRPGFFARSPAWVKFAVALCGVLIVVLLLVLRNNYEFHWVGITVALCGVLIVLLVLVLRAQHYFDY